MKTREQIIHDMCMTMNHSYAMPTCSNDWPGGMLKEHKDALYREMSQLFDNCISPHMFFKEDK